MRAGDRVTLIALPQNLHDDEELETRSLFEKCLGKTFLIAGIETVDGLPHQMIKLDVGAVRGQADYLETIWVEPECLRVEDVE